MAINDTTALGLPTGRSAARRRRTLTGPAGTSAPAPPCPADVDATPLHPLVAERAAPAPEDGADGGVPAHVAAPAAPAPHQALLALLEAHNAVAAELSLPRVLRRVVEGAREITGARYAALTLCAPDGSPSTQVESGPPEEVPSAVPEFPSDPSSPVAPERSHRSAEQQPSLGWPPGRARYRSFRVPVTARGSVLGHLHVSGPPAGRVFTADDEDLVSALAMTAEIAVLNVQGSDGLPHRQEPTSEPENRTASRWVRVVGRRRAR